MIPLVIFKKRGVLLRRGIYWCTVVASTLTIVYAHIFFDFELPNLAL